MPGGPLLIPVIVASIVLSVLAIGLGTTPGVALRFLRQPAPVVRALAAMFLVMPIMAIALALLLPLEPAGRTALLALSLSPLPPLFVRKAQEEDEGYVMAVAFAAAMTSVLVAPLFVQLIGWLFDFQLSFAAGQLIGILMITVVAPLLAGIAVNHWFPALASRMRRPLGLAGNAILVTGATALVVAAWSDIAAAAAAPVGLLAVAIMIGTGLAVGHALAGPERRRRRLLAVATISRHPGVAIALGSMAGSVPAYTMLGTVLFYFLLSAAVGVAYSRLSGPGGGQNGAIGKVESQTIDSSPIR